MNDGESLDEFCEDFSALGPDDTSLARILAQARAVGDADIRRLVKEVQYWRFITPLLLDRVAPRGSPIDESDPILKLARFQIRAEGAIGTKPTAG